MLQNIKHQKKVKVHCYFTYPFGLHKRRKGTNTIKSKREPDTVGQKIQGLTKQKVNQKNQTESKQFI